MLLRGLAVSARAGRSAVIAVLVVRLADESAFFVAPGSLESFRADLGLSYAEAATVLAAAAPGAVVGNACAVLADHRSRRVIAAGGAFGFALALATFGAGNSFGALVVSSALMGAASTAMVDAAEIALVDLAGADLRRYLARANLLGTIGDLAGPALLAVVFATGASWRVAFVVAAAALAAYGLVLAVSPLPAPAPERRGDAAHTPMRVLREVLADGRVWSVGVVAALFGPWDESLLGFVIALAENERGASPALATVVALVGVSGGLVAFTVLSDRLTGIDDRRILVGSAGAMTVAVVPLALAPSLVVVAAAAFVISVGLNLGWLALQHRSLTLRPGQAGTTKAVVTTVEFAGFVLPVAVGAAADRWGLPSGVLVYVLIGVVLATAAIATGRSGASEPAPE